MYSTASRPILKTPTRHVRFADYNTTSNLDDWESTSDLLNLDLNGLKVDSQEDKENSERSRERITRMLRGLRLSPMPESLEKSMWGSPEPRNRPSIGSPPPPPVSSSTSEYSTPNWSISEHMASLLSPKSQPSLKSPPENPSPFNSFNFFGNDSIWSPNPTANLSLISNGHSQLLDKVERVAQKYRNSAKKVEANYHWSGQLPRKVRTRHPIYSCKVFLGGIPYDLTEEDVHLAFAQFGNIIVQWPGKDVRSAIDGALAQKAGYVYIIFDNYDNVNVLLNNCIVKYLDGDSTCRWYFSISSRRCKGKEVQVIPFDIGDRFYMKGAFSGQMDHSKTVFVGALHGMLTAEGLAKVMDDLFGGVVFVGLDTDKYKYPLGSGRVAFDNHDSYYKAVSAAFVEIKSARFKKKIQIDPYIENESMCGICKTPQQASIFCRDMSCFRYYCRTCWDIIHNDKEMSDHRPLIKNKTN